MLPSKDLSHDPAMNAEEVARYLGIAVGTVYNKVHDGEIPFFRVGRAVRFRRSVIDSWVEEQTAEGVA